MVKIKDIVELINKNGGAVILINQVLTMIAEDQIKTCKSCGGQGVVFAGTEINLYPFECPDCNGQGYVLK